MIIIIMIIIQIIIMCPVCELTSVEVDLPEAVSRYFGRTSLMAVKLTIYTGRETQAKKLNYRQSVSDGVNKVNKTMNSE